MNKNIAFTNIFLFLFYFFTEGLLAGFSIFLSFLFNVFFILLMIFLNYKYLKNSFVNFKKKYFYIIPATYVGYILMNNLIFYLFSLLNLQKNDVSQNQEILETLIYQSPIWTVIIISLFAPFIEEIVFRGSLFAAVGGKNIFSSKTKIFLAFILSIIFFTVVHVQTESLALFSGEISILEFLNFSYAYIVLSIFFGSLYIYSRGNILVSMGLHFVVNVVASILMLTK